MHPTVAVSRASVADAEEILALIRRAFVPVAERYADPALPPLVESLDDHRARYASHVVLKATNERGAIVGTVQGILRSDGTCYVARLAVEPAMQARGIGRALTEALEAEFAGATRFELFTGGRCAGSLALYESLGYTETRRERVDDRLTVVWMAKAR